MTRLAGAWPWLLILAVGAFHVAMLRDGFDWFHDSVAYVNHAENLAAGRDYSRSGYIPNPYRYIAPKAYPPGYPLLLAPVVKVAGPDPKILRIEGIVLLLAALAAVWRLARDQLPAPYLAALLAAVGLHPLIWENLQRLLSDVPFLLFVVLSLVAYGRARTATGARRRIALGALAGALAWYAIITRSLGVALIPAIFLHDLIDHRFRRVSAPAIALAAAVALLSVAGSRTPIARSLEEAGMVDVPPNPYLALRDAPGGTAAPDSARARPKYRHSHVSLMLGNVLRNGARIPHRAARNVGQYFRWGAELWDNGRAPVLGKALFAVAAGVAAVGFVHRVRRRRAAGDVFFVVYFLALLPWSFAERRYLFPLLPFAWLFLLTGVRVLAQAGGAGARGPLVATVLLVGGTYGAKYASVDRGPLQDEYAGPDARALYEFLDAAAEADEVLVAEYPRQLAYFTGLRVSAPHRELDERAWWPHVGWLGARYVVAGPVKWPEVPRLSAFVESAPARFEKVLDTPTFRVYRMRSP